MKLSELFHLKFVQNIKTFLNNAENIRNGNNGLFFPCVYYKNMTMEACANF